ncbi:MAG: transketolase C-terminal domain-containing protein [Thalassobaculum sp.]
MARTVADTIRELTREHIDANDGMVLGQCLTAVGWVQNTVPEQTKGIHELPMTDIAGAGIAVGAAIMGRRPIFLIRFQSFLWLNASPIVNYAAKSKEMFGYGAPVFVRAIASEGGGSGPLHTNCFHSLFMHMPGMTVTAPMTPGEYEAVWSHYMDHDDPMLVSEHRNSYGETEDRSDVIRDDAEVTIFAVSAARFEAEKALALLSEQGVAANLIHVVWLKPFSVSDAARRALKQSGRGLVCDSAFTICGASESVAYNLMLESGVPVKAIGMEDRSSGVAPHLENHTPNAERIADEAKAMIGKNRRESVLA